VRNAAGVGQQGAGDWQPSQAKSAIRLDLGPINQVDGTWINGKPLGNTFGYGTERSYALSPGILHAGDNLLVVNVLSTYGEGGLLAGGSRRALRLSDGEPVPLEGPWEYRRGSSRRHTSYASALLLGRQPGLHFVRPLRPAGGPLPAVHSPRSR
jgi:hypothetical protein